MKNQRITTLILMALMAIAGLAQASFSLVPPNRAIEGKKFSITFRVSNGQGSAPQAPVIENCRLVYGPAVSTMMSQQVVGNRITSTSTTDYTFSYLAEKAGTSTIPAVTVSVDGKPMSSKPYELTILPPDSPGSGGGGAPSASQSQSSQAPTNDMFVLISLSKSQAYVQEAVIATVKVYTRENISAFQTSAQPTFEGFLAEELPVPSGTEIEHYNGKNYYTACLKRCILYPQKSGTLTITSGKYDVTIVDYEIVSNGFFQTRRPVERNVTTQSNNATLHVIALPAPKPDGFNGAVGDYTASVEMKPTELRTNEAASYILTVKGTGNIKYLKTPKLDIPAGIDEFTPKTDIDARFNGSNMTGSYSVNYTLVPQDPGTFTIPARTFSYFNPATKKYSTIDLEPFTIKVAQGNSVATVTEQKSIAKGMTDILHIKATEGTLSLRHRYAFRSAGYWLLYALASLVLALVAWFYRRSLKLNADVRGRKLARANKQALKRLKAARKVMQTGNSDDFYKVLGSAMWGYISDKLAIPASQLVRDHISQQLADYGLSEEGIAGTISVLDDCEMARFTPALFKDQMPEILQKAEVAIKMIENVK